MRGIYTVIQSLPSPSRVRISRVLGRVVAAVVTAVVLAGGGVSSVQAQSQHAPALQFTSPTVLRLHPETRLWARDTDMHPVDGKGVLGRKRYYFDALAAQQSAADELTFTVEGQGGEAQQYCFESRCGAVSVEVLAELGHLYLGLDIAEFKNRNDTTNRAKSRALGSRSEDFRPQRVEVAVQAGSRKVYQEVVVAAPASAPDCSDYPTRNEDRFRCYYTREYGAAAFREPAPELLAGLPGQLVQDREQYEVVFAEEFTGSYTPTAEQHDKCDRGLAELDKSKWNHRHKLCRRPRQGDPQGAPCEYLEDGHLHIASTGECGSDLNSRGLFEPRYGYVEISYTISASRSPESPSRFQNYNMLLGNLNRAEREPLRSHNLEINSLERFLTLVNWVELDLVEYGPRYRPDVIGHQYRNWLHVHHPAVLPLRTNKKMEFCQDESSEGVILRYQPPNCGNTAARITITEGMEWTPEGYLFLRRVHGLDDTPTIPDKSGTEIQAATWADNSWHINGNNRRLVSGTERAAYFVQPDPDDTAFYLEALGIGHAPSAVYIGAWGFSRAQTNQVEMTIDYIRVFQPRNRYADMEPRYQ